MRKATAFGGAATAALLAASAATYAFAQGGPLPWGQSADQLAWETFVQVVAPSGQFIANPNAPGPARVEFETWASDQDIYTATPHWPAIGSPKRLQQTLLGTAGLRHGSTIEAPEPESCNPPNGQQAAKDARFPAGACIGEEVRRNWASYQYIVSNGLYTQAGFAKAYANNLVVDLPADAIEFKGDWVKVKDLAKWVSLTPQQIHNLYYVNTATSGGETTEFALVSFHFSTKQQKNWVWADFEHEKNPGRCDVIGCHDSYGATVQNVQPRSTNWQQYGSCQKSPAVLSMFANGGLGTVWSHYCLKGSQISFTTPRWITKKVKVDVPTLLGNSVIEAINADVPIKQSSCISCHAYASFNSQGQFNGPALGKSPIGKVNPQWMSGFRANDFIWGIVAASPPAPPPAAPTH
ncbi:MAG: hypothetical protein JOZ90_07010 [Alphaproteobacteria bacterium]|nr:hypothetical protein [Alphaproteobacteria bacterium]MBV9370428.1 hypothetical protein [Alphaproteobacteria bacterium]MBV9900832.1 hypothetical protein [Alphaproteobacteria bacterium]